MAGTRSQSKKSSNGGDGSKKRSAGETDRAGDASPPEEKKAKVEKDGKLAIGESGEVGLEQEEDDASSKDESAKKDTEEEHDTAKKEAQGDDVSKTAAGAKEEGKGGEDSSGKSKAASKDAPDDPGAKGLKDPQHGTLESGHIYFLYRPKIGAGEEVHGLDDVSKFHILLLPKSAPYDKGHYHRVIEVGKKKMPDPGAKHQVIWGLVGGVGKDKGALKKAFGAYSYETKTMEEDFGHSLIPGTRHQAAARPAARGHYILHSPRDTAADDPGSSKQRDYRTLLAYEITTPTSEDFGSVQEELGIAVEGAVTLSIKEPHAESRNNPRAASIPKEQKAHYPPHLMDLFQNRRWVACNPPSFLDYEGTELLIISSSHHIADALGEDGDKVEEKLEADAEKEAVGVQDAMEELGMSKGDTEVEALEGEWA